MRNIRDYDSKNIKDYDTKESDTLVAERKLLEKITKKIKSAKWKVSMISPTKVETDDIYHRLVLDTGEMVSCEMEKNINERIARYIVELHNDNI